MFKQQNVHSSDAKYTVSTNSGNSNTNKITAIYCRLSHEDELKGDSMSIQNQRDLLGRYASENGFSNVRFYSDDGYTGTNFNRPAFQEMLSDIENDKIGTVIVKDLSRLGREYLQTGYYTEMVFPEHNVRFIAVNDGVDSDNGYNDFAPFKNIINEFYAKEASIKIKAVLRNKALKGEAPTGKTPYGYKKDETGKKFLPDDNADNVREMFQLALQGYSCAQIANMYTKRGLRVPMAVYYDGIGKKDAKCYPEFPTMWTPRTVQGILTNPVYTGGIYALKTKRISFKNKREVNIPREEWVVTLNTHEALVSEADFETVCERVSLKCRDRTVNPDNLFRGIIICADCGGRLSCGSYTTQSEGKMQYYRCHKYVRTGTRGCTQHYLRFNDLYEIVLKDIQQHCSLAADNKDKYVDMLIKASAESGCNGKTALTKELDKASSRIKELDRILQKLYEDNALGKISDDRYHEMSDNMEQEYKQLKSRVQEINTTLSETERAKKNAVDFAELITKYTDIKELDADLLHMLIDRIVVHEKEEKDGETVQHIDIYYRFIGNTSLENADI